MFRLTVFLLFVLLTFYKACAVKDPFILSWISKVFGSLDKSFFDPTPSTNRRLVVNNLKPISFEYANYYVYLAFTAYCQTTMETWTCPYCLKAGRHIRFVTKVENASADTLAYFAVDDKREEIILAYRGSQNAPNAYSDVAFMPVALDSSIKVHGGLYDAQNSLNPEVPNIMDKLITKYPDYKVILVGHSLGGAMAAIHLFLIMYSGQRTETNFELYTYGTPRHGNKAYATKFNSFDFPTGRIVNKADVFAHIGPYGMDFFHTANEIFTVHGKTRRCSNKYYEDLTCAVSEAPFYSVADHVSYFDVNASTCLLLDSPVEFILQLIINLKPYIPPSLITELQLNLVNLDPSSATILQELITPVG